jgi:hypothetical protein
MKRTIIDLNLSLEQLENDYWVKPSAPMSSLVTRVHELRKKKLKDFEVEDFRLLIGQNIGLSVVIPLALKILEKNILSEGDYYEGDLLFATLNVENNFWFEHMDEAIILRNLYRDNERIIQDFDTSDEIKEKLNLAFQKFQDSLW